MSSEKVHGEPRDVTPDEVAVFRLPFHIYELEDVAFGPDELVFVPGHRTTGSVRQDRSTGVEALAAVLHFAAEHPGKRLLITGHTDTVGDPTSNLRRSQQRARGVYHLLRGERGAWAALAAECDAQGVELRRALAWLADERHWGCAPAGDVVEQAALDGLFELRRELLAQVGWAKRLEADASDPWVALFDVFEVELAAALAPSTLGAARASLRSFDVPWIGCGEGSPIDHRGEDETRSSINHRVDLVFLDPSEATAASPLPTDPSSPLALYGELRRAFKPQYVPTRPAPRPFRLTVEVSDGVPLAGATVEVRQGGSVRRVKLDGHGTAELPDVVGHCEVVLVDRPGQRLCVLPGPTCDLPEPLPS